MKKSKKIEHDKIVNYRFEVISFAKKESIISASKKYNISRNTVAIWIKKFKLFGLKGLKNKSRKNQSFPNKMRDEVLQKIIKFRKQNPKFGALKIIKELQLDCSAKTVEKKLKESGLLKEYKPSPRYYEYEAFRKNKEPFRYLYFSIHTFKDKIINNNIVDSYTSNYNDNLPKYLLVVKDISTDTLYIAFSHEKTNLSSAIFIDYLFQKLKNNGIQTDKIILNITKGNEFIQSSKQSLFEEIVLNKYKVKLTVNKDERTILKVDIKKNLEDMKQQLIVNNFKNNKDLLIKSFSYIIHNNFFKNKENNISKLIGEKVLKISPIIVDSHIRNILKIRNSDSYWKLSEKESEEIVKNTISYFQEKGDDAKKEYKNLEALKYYDRLLSIVGDYKNDLSNSFLEIEVGKNSKNISKKIEILQKKVDLLELVGLWDKSLKILEELHKYFTGINDEEGILFSLLRIGNIHRNKGDNKEALSYYNRSLIIAKKLDNEIWISATYNALGIIYANMQKFKEAMGFLKKRLKIVLKIDSKNEIAATVCNMGYIYFSQKRRKKALEYFEKDLEICKDLNDLRGIAIASGNVGIVQYEMKQYDEAIENFEIKLSISEQMSDKKGISKALGNMGLVYTKLKDYKKAMSYLKNKLKLAIELGDKSEIAYSYGYIARVLFKEKKYEDSIKNLNEQKAISEKNDYKNILVLYYDLYSKIEIIKRNYSSALLLLEKKLELTIFLDNNYEKKLTKAKLNRIKKFIS